MRPKHIGTYTVTEESGAYPRLSTGKGVALEMPIRKGTDASCYKIGPSTMLIHFEGPDE